MINAQYKTIQRSNGNLTVYEYVNGNLSNKIVQKGNKHYVTSFLPDRQRIATLVYEHNPKVILKTKNGDIEIKNNKVQLIPSEKSVSKLGKLIFSILPEKNRTKKIIRKSDGKEYFRLLKPIDFNPKSNFIHKMIDRALVLYSGRAEMFYLNELLKKGKV